MKTYSVLGAILISGLFSTAVAQANFILPADSSTQLGEGITDGSLLIAVVSKERSYCCGINPSPTDGASITSFNNFGDVSPAPVARADELPILNGVVPARRYCWYEAADASSSGRQLVVDTGGDTIKAIISCDDTTLTGSYNTSVSEFNFLELTGQTGDASTSSTITGKIIYRSAIDNTVIENDFSISFVDGGGSEVAPIRRIDLAVHDIIGNKADFGQIRIRHDGAPGQLSAKISYYDVTSTSPLDFSLVGQDNFVKGLAIK